MRKLVGALAALVAVCGLVFAHAAEGQKTKTRIKPPPVHFYNYDQAVANGLIKAFVLKPGQRVCHLTGQGGFKTAKAAAAAAARASDKPACIADPRQAMYGSISAADIKTYGAAAYGVMNPIPRVTHARKRKATCCGTFVPYYYMGGDGLTGSSTPVQGENSICQVTDPNHIVSGTDQLDNQNWVYGAEHVVCSGGAVYPSSCNPDNGDQCDSLEIGWVEGYGDGHETGNTQQIFTEQINALGGITVQFYSYSLTVGNWYSVRARDYTNGGSYHDAVADIFWGSSWVELQYSHNIYMQCTSTGTDKLCLPTEHVEVESNYCWSQGEGTLDCPKLSQSTPGGINQSPNAIRTAVGTWGTWYTNTIVPFRNLGGGGYKEGPYTTTYNSTYYDFTAKKP